MRLAQHVEHHQEVLRPEQVVDHRLHQPRRIAGAAQAEHEDPLRRRQRLLPARDQSVDAREEALAIADPPRPALMKEADPGGPVAQHLAAAPGRDHAVGIAVREERETAGDRGRRMVAGEAAEIERRQRPRRGGRGDQPPAPQQLVGQAVLPERHHPVARPLRDLLVVHRDRGLQLEIVARIGCEVLPRLRFGRLHQQPRAHRLEQLAGRDQRRRQHHRMPPHQVPVGIETLGQPRPLRRLVECVELDAQAGPFPPHRPTPRNAREGSPRAGSPRRNR